MVSRNFEEEERWQPRPPANDRAFKEGVGDLVNRGETMRAWLREVSEAAQEKERRIHAFAERSSEELTAARKRVETLEHRLAEAEQRAEEAERLVAELNQTLHDHINVLRENVRART